MHKRFNVRVYGILVEQSKLLVSDEFIKGKEICKLPGGGLEFGEGPAECIVREFKEETNLNVAVQSHFYTTDFFVTSAFDIKSQVISIYYTVKALEKIKLQVSTKRFDFKKKVEGAQSFRWIEIDKISENDFTFVIDRKVATLIAEQKKLFLNEK
ncbi:MAG TPA: NUDIX domain-containing protein [Bacteroidia bacterium]|jgi:8-oxo-dGTP diphosphatase|nr:NUDIX domain-containing protein [Bacteroidia bacterium]